MVLEVAGQDGTEGFEDVGHSQDARTMLAEYQIGELPEEEKEAVCSFSFTFKCFFVCRNSSRQIVYNGV